MRSIYTETEREKERERERERESDKTHSNTACLYNMIFHIALIVTVLCTNFLILAQWIFMFTFWCHIEWIGVLKE